VRGKRFAGVAADEAGAASDKNGFHRSIVFSASAKLNKPRKGRFLRQHRQHRLRTPLWASEVAPSGLITPTVLTMLTMPSQLPCSVDDADGDHPPPFTRYPQSCPSCQSIPTAVEGLCPKALILIIRAPNRPSRANEMSISSMRRKVCARRSRPANARGCFTHGGVAEASSRALSAHRRNRSDALPLQLLRSPMMVRTQVASGSASTIVSAAARRLAA
jgi:hypothetical protein